MSGLFRSAMRGNVAAASATAVAGWRDYGRRLTTISWDCPLCTQTARGWFCVGRLAAARLRQCGVMSGSEAAPPQRRAVWHA